MSMRTASPSRPRYPATGSVICSTHPDGHCATAATRRGEARAVTAVRSS
jgi:hypothetical protein